MPTNRKTSTSTSTPVVAQRGRELQQRLPSIEEVNHAITIIQNSMRPLHAKMRNQLPQRLSNFAADLRMWHSFARRQYPKFLALEGQDQQTGKQTGKGKAVGAKGKALGATAGSRRSAVVA